MRGGAGCRGWLAVKADEEVGQFWFYGERISAWTILLRSRVNAAMQTSGVSAAVCSVGAFDISKGSETPMTLLYASSPM